MELAHAVVHHRLEVLDVVTLAGRDEDAAIVHLGHPSLHELVERNVLLVFGVRSSSSLGVKV